MLRSFLLLVLFLLLCGCSTTNDVVSRGPFQKRKYLPGWHVDLALNKDRSTPPVVREQPVEPMATRALTAAPMVPSQPLVASTGTTTNTPPARRIRVRHETLEPAIPFTLKVATTPPLDEPASEQTGTERRWNRIALISGVFLVLSIAAMAVGGGEILLYLLTFSFITGVIGLLLAIKHKERGKGIAIAAFAFPVVLIALAIAALNAVW